jgi:hypothetical protein
MVKRFVGGVAAVVALTLAGVVTTSPGAEAAEPAALSCSPGYACILNDAGQVIYRNAGNTGPISVAPGGYGGRVWNNGVRYPGLDHIQLYVRNASGWTLTICLHYGPQTISQPDPTVGGLQSRDTVTSWRWRGECVGEEDTWHRIA